MRVVAVAAVLVLGVVVVVVVVVVAFMGIMLLPDARMRKRTMVAVATAVMLEPYHHNTRIALLMEQLTCRIFSATVMFPRSIISSTMWFVSLVCGQQIKGLV